MSTASFVEGPNGVLSAWETSGQVYFAKVKPDSAEVLNPVPAPGAGKDRKHPVLAVNRRGETLMAWTEGTGWNRGGALAWQIFDAHAKPTPESGRIEGGIPVWGLAAAVAKPDGSFLIIH